jgi:hypothetical protein
MMRPIGIAKDLAAPEAMNHPGGMRIETPNIGQGGIGRQNVETEMAGHHEKAPLAKSVAGTKDLSHLKPPHSKQTRTPMLWL